MSFLLTILLLAINFFISWSNASYVGRYWSESKEVGGSFRRYVVCGYVMAIAGFTMVYGYILLLIAPFVLEYYNVKPEIIAIIQQISSDAIYLIVSVPIILSGFRIWILSLKAAWEERTFRYLLNAGWNSYAQISNMVNFARNAPSAAGGVISWWGNNGTLENCNFINNSASSAGGAVLWKGNDGSIKNCNFSDNTVITAADVSLTSGEGYDPSQLHIMTVNSDGGALYLQGNNISVDYCNFINNVADFSGGAITIHWGNNITVSNSKFKKNNAGQSGGAIAWNGDDALIINSKFNGNGPNDLFLNSHNITIINSKFLNESCIESWDDVNYTNVTFEPIDTFDDLAFLINNTPEGGILLLDDDYSYVNGSNKGILISKSITIDGNGHTLDGNRLSRMFNITADNVTIKNINFINGNAYGRYFSNDVGGGAIYWNGANGYLENCTFTDNRGSGIEDDPFDKEESYVDENGVIWHTIRFRPMGAKLNEGGAIVWNGTNGTVYKCIFKNNNVGYPDYGGAICWRGNFGNVLESEFYGNSAWGGAAIAWIGDNGTILYSKFINSGEIFERDIMWFGKNGLIKYSFLIASNGRTSLYPYSGNVIADYNFWGDILPDTKIDKISNLNNFIVLNASYNTNFVKKGDSIVVSCNVLLIEKGGNASNFTGLDIPGNITAVADRDGFVQLNFNEGYLKVVIVPKTKIVSKDLTTYYKKSIKFKVRVYGADGKIAAKKYVKFTFGKKTYEIRTDKKGYATFKINKKPGQYKIIVQYDDFKVKNKIKIKSTLITKDLSKKAKKAGKFKVKVLNSKGKAFKNQAVKIKFKGKTYKLKTNKKGIAVFNVSKNLKVGKYTIKTVCNGLKNSNKIIVKK